MRYVITVQEQPETWAEMSAGAKVMRCLSMLITVGMLALAVGRR